jgi:hypothetical protein
VGKPRIMPADEICIVGPKVAEEVVKRSVQKRGTIREHQEIGLVGIPCPRTQIAPTLADLQGRVLLPGTLCSRHASIAGINYVMDRDNCTGFA